LPAGGEQRDSLRWPAAQGFTAALLLTLTFPAMMAQWRVSSDVDFNYRQRVPLGKQAEEVSVGFKSSNLWVDADTANSIRALQRMAKTSGFVAGMAVQDFTGDGAGIIFAIGGRPLATAWMGGGYPGSEAAASKLLDNIDQHALAGAWLISSSNNPRAIKGWQELLKRRLGRSNSHEAAGTALIRAPYDWQPDAPEMWEVVIWRPVSR
jgi:hypothetical protein